jgi:hypothetical protein
MTTRKARPASPEAAHGSAGAARFPAARFFAARCGRSGTLIALVALTGCATKGPLHVYTVGDATDRPILDRGPAGDTTGPSFLKPHERLTGFAYDPYTDHFFLRLAPGNRIRVVDRPARALKREFEIAGAPAGQGDLAVRPLTGHLYLLGPGPAQVLQATRLGQYLGAFTLAGASPPLQGLAYDSTHDRLLALGPDGRRVTLHDRSGGQHGELTLAAAAGPALAFDADAREIHAPLRDRPGDTGVFDEQGRLLRTVALPAASGLVDVGPRSFVRVF